jgi:hypothetical protein
VLSSPFAQGRRARHPGRPGVRLRRPQALLRQVYYPCLDETRGRPFGYYVRGGSDVTGAVRAGDTITTGLGWRRSADAVTASGEPSKADLETCWELGATLAAGLMD